MSTHNIPFSIHKRKSTLIILNLQLWDFFARDSRSSENIDNGQDQNPKYRGFNKKNKSMFLCSIPVMFTIKADHNKNMEVTPKQSHGCPKQKQRNVHITIKSELKKKMHRRKF